MKITKMPFENHVYLISDIYENVEINKGHTLQLTNEGREFQTWLETCIHGKYRNVGVGMIKIDPEVESLFVLKWI